MKAKTKGKKEKHKLKAIRCPVEASLDDVYLGNTIKMPFDRVRICKACAGYIEYTHSHTLNLGKDAKQERIARNVRLATERNSS
jgi:DnaJ-class molecular chaperone